MPAPSRNPQYAWTAAGDSWISERVNRASLEMVLTSPTQEPLQVILGGAGTVTVAAQGFERPLPLPLQMPVGSTLPVGRAGGTWRFWFDQRDFTVANGVMTLPLHAAVGPNFDQPVSWPATAKIPAAQGVPLGFDWSLQLRPAGASCGFLQGLDAGWTTWSGSTPVQRTRCAHFSTVSLLERGALTPSRSHLAYSGSGARSIVTLQYSPDGQNWASDGGNGVTVVWQAKTPVVYSSGSPALPGWLGGAGGDGPWTLRVGNQPLAVSSTAARSAYVRLSLATDLAAPTLSYVVEDAAVRPCPSGVLYSPVPAAREVNEHAGDGQVYRWRSDLVVGTNADPGSNGLGWIGRLWWDRSADARVNRPAPFNLFFGWRGKPADVPTGQAFVRVYAREVDAGPDSPTYGLALLELRGSPTGPVLAHGNANTDTLSLRGLLQGDAVLVSSAWSRVPFGPGSGLPCPGSSDSRNAPPVTPGPGPPPGPPISPRTEELVVGGLTLLAAIWLGRSIF